MISKVLSGIDSSTVEIAIQNWLDSHPGITIHGLTSSSGFGEIIVVIIYSV